MKIVNFSKVAIGLILVAQFAFANMLDDVKGVQKACEGGDMEKCNVLAGMYQLGIMFEKDAAKAMELYEKACGGNVYSTCAQAGLQYIKEFDDKKAEELLTKACDNRVSLGCSGLGVLYRMTDKEKGVVYFQKACDTGENEWAACKGAGEDYYSLGRKEMAKKYLKKACDLGKEHIGVKYDPDLKKSWQEACDLYITIK